MSDFLHQLRSGGKKRYDKSRRTYDNPQYRSHDRMGGRDKRPHTHRRNYDQSDSIALKKILEGIAETQKRQIEISRRQAAASERIAASLEKIDAYLADFGTDRVPEVENEQKNTASDPEYQAPRDAADSKEETKELGRENIVELIVRKRSEGVDFDNIARFLEAESIPTLSGKGKWRAQSVSRLYNQNLES